MTLPVAGKKFHLTLIELKSLAHWLSNSLGRASFYLQHRKSNYVSTILLS